MSAQIISAVAAVAAAVISLVNVSLTAFLVRRHDSEKWVRELLPDLIVKFTDAAFRYERAIFATDWRPLTNDERNNLGMDEFDEASKHVDMIEAFASPETATSAHNVLYAVDKIRFISIELVATNEFEPWHPRRRASYWDYAEAHHSFMIAARSEMGLKPLPVPPGLERWRKGLIPDAPRLPHPRAKSETNKPSEGIVDV